MIRRHIYFADGSDPLEKEQMVVQEKERRIAGIISCNREEEVKASVGAWGWPLEGHG